MKRNTTNPEITNDAVTAPELSDEMKRLVEEARNEGFRSGYDAAARAHIQRTYGVWSPPSRLSDESEMETGGDFISCIVPGTWDF